MPNLSAAPHMTDTVHIQGSAAFAFGNIRLHIDLAYIPTCIGARHRLSWRCPDNRLNGAGKCRADASDRGAGDGGPGLHTGCSAEGYDSNDQGVFNQVLTFLVANKVMNLLKQSKQ